VSTVEHFKIYINMKIKMTQ